MIAIATADMAKMTTTVAVNNDVTELDRAISEIDEMRSKLDNIKSRRFFGSLSAKALEEQLTAKETATPDDSGSEDDSTEGATEKAETPFWIQCCVDSSLHCLPNIFTAETIFSKLWWAFLLLIMLALTAIHTYSTFSDFLEHPTVTNIAFKKTTQLDYPVLVICSNTLMLNWTALPTELEQDDVYQIFYMAGAMPSDPFYHNLSDSATTWLANQLSGGRTMDKFIAGFFAKYGLTCDQVFLLCKNPDGHFFDCCSLFVPIFHLTQGRCFTQNPDTFPMVISPGIHSDFKIDMHWFNGTDTLIHVYYGTGKEQAWKATDYVKLSTTDKETSWMQTYPSKINSDSEKGLCDPEPQLEYFPDYTYHNCMFERRMATNPEGTGFLDQDCLPGLYVDIKPSVREVDKRRICTPKDFDALDPAKYNIHYYLRSTNVSLENPCAPPCEALKYDVKITKSEKYNPGYFEMIITFPSMEYPEYSEKPSMDWYDYVSLVGDDIQDPDWKRGCVRKCLV